MLIMVTYTFVLMMIASVTQAYLFEISNQYECRNWCVDTGMYYFSRTDMSGGRCCNLKGETAEECSLAGHSTTNEYLMKYFACPQGPRCGPNLIIAKEKSQTYSLDLVTIKPDEAICNH